MSKNVLILTGSARPNSVGHKVLPLIEKQAVGTDLSLTTVDVAGLELPFFDAPMPPSAPGYEPTHESVKAWGDKVKQADGVILLLPEYNANMTAIQKNAIDWLFAEWNDKPVAIVGYGFHEPSRSGQGAKLALAQVKAKLVEPMAQLQFGQDLAPDGTVIDASTVDAKIRQVLDALRSQIV